MSGTDPADTQEGPPVIPRESEFEKEKDDQHQGRPEVGGPPGPEPTRYGDWEKNGRCIDF